MPDQPHEPDEAVTRSSPQVPEEELRLALVLNGGVSLAVWMGGVAREIQRLTDPTPDGYGPILALARRRAVTDVISGTSAGGINGAALALAQVNTRADLGLLRNLWSDQGRMEELLREPFRGEPSSLLRGDEYFLPELRRAMRALAVPFERRVRPGTDQPTSVDLTITTTLLSGSQLVTVDDLGQDLPQRLNDATFRFTFDASEDEGATEETKQQGYAAETLRKARAMALAARATASFPFAFEPVFIPVNGEGHSPDDDDMSEFASWAKAGAGDVSRYAVDGGVLANTPTQAALKAIDRRGAEGPVRRAMLLVFPHAPAVADIPADLAAEPPTTVGGLSSVLGALQSQGSRTYVERIEEHNRVAADWRGGRLQVLETMGDDIDSLFDLARVAWKHYGDLRKRRAALDLTERVRFLVDEQRRPFEQIRAQAERAQRELDPSPYLPHAAPTPDGVLGPGWEWGYTTGLGVADAAAEVLRAALALASGDDAIRLSASLKAVTAHRLSVLEAREETDRVWEEDPHLRSLDPDRTYWVMRGMAYRRAVKLQDPNDEKSIRAYFATHAPQVPRETVQLLLDRHGAQGNKARKAVVGIVRQLVRVLPLVRELAAGPANSRVLHAWGPLLALPVEMPTGQDAPWLTQRLLALDVAVWLVADGPATGTSLPIRLVQLSLQTPHRWAVHSTTPDDKAAGMELARFGGFLKRSWRMNDWLWGRLDAAVVLCRTVLDPERLGQVGALAEGIPVDREELDGITQLGGTEFATLRAALLDGEPEPRQMQLLAQAAAAELERALLGDPRQTSFLDNLAAYAAFPIQARIALEELPVIASAIAQDGVEGAGKRSRGERFLASEKGLLEDVRDHRPGQPGWLELGARALTVFDAAGIGREPLADEAGSDAMVRTTTKAAAVAATLVDSGRFGVSAIRPVTSVVRGASLLPYWIVNGLAGGAPLARFLATLGLVGGGVLLALGLFGVLGWAGPVSGTVGAATLIAALGYSALRTGSLLHGVALLGPVLPLAAYAIDKDPGSQSGETAGGLLALLVLVAGLYVLGRVPWPLRSPNALVHSRAFKRQLLRGVAGLLGIAAVVGLWLLGGLAWHERGNLVIAAGLSVATALLGGVLSDRCSKGLRRWRPGRTASELPTRGEGIAGPFAWEPVDDSDGVAASWAPVYGATYLAAAWALSFAADATGGRDPRTWNWVSAALAAWAVLGVVLLLVAPVLLSRRSWRRSGQVVVTAGPLVGDAKRPALLRRLVQVDAASWHYCRPATGDPGPSRKAATPELRLTRAGERLGARLVFVQEVPAEPGPSRAATGG
jgi:patatin-related protein